MHATIRRDEGVDTTRADALSRKARETLVPRLQLTKFLHWRKMTWLLVLWSGYMPVWMVVTGSGAVVVVLWWLAGMILLGSLWLATQPLFQQGRGLDGFFVRPHRKDWRVVHLHRTHRAMEPTP